ncbi:MAG: M14 family zinc carboxypeptidase [Myxococcota bacterium]|nr:M14 family zinc carboxypeptidase [Myxococcota bacterium]
MFWLILTFWTFAAPQILGQSIGYRPISLEKMGDGPDHIAFIASIHGNEYGGSVMLPMLVQALEHHPEWLSGRTVYFIQLANPDAYVDQERSNRNWVDINRNFPSHNHVNSRRGGPVPLSETESQAIVELLNSYDLDRIITLHEPYNCIDYDGPGEALAQSMSEVSGLEVCKLGSRSGSMGSYLGQQLNIPFITVEFPYGAGFLEPDILWSRYGSMLIQAILFQKSSSEAIVDDD